MFEANGKQISYLLQRIHDRELAVPDFQRDFVWDSKSTVELLRSIMSRYPAGTLLFWKQGDDNAAFAARAVDGAPQLGSKSADELILDGQQRLTSLFRALTGVAEETYFLRLRKFLSQAGDVHPVHEVDFDEAIVVVEGSTKDIDPSDRGWQYAEGLFPLQRLDDFHEWLDGFARAAAPDADQEYALKRQLRAVYDAYLVPLRSYGFPVVTLPAKTALEAVCNIFETLNRTGKPLGASDLVTARLYPSGVNLRELSEEARERDSILDDFDVETYPLLQAVSLRVRRSAQRADVLRSLTADDIREHWTPVASGAAAVLDLLQNDYGVLGKRWLPYGMLIVTMAAAWPEVRAMKPLERSGALERLSQYFWCTTFMANFDQGANSQAGADYSRLSKWLADPEAEAPEAVASFSFSESTLRAANVRRKALHAGVMALTIRMGAKDFHSAQRLTALKVKEKRIDSHHIFPKGFLPKGVPSELLLNRALIDAETNKIIGKRPPSQYLDQMEKTYGAEKLLDVLDSHAIQQGPDSGLSSDDYEQFLSQRLTAVVDLIERVTGHAVTKDVTGGDA
ncbi:DUF262 domain-containing protein [Pseudonocardia nematodicida]|uniref:DUF262 domain-containing protein n=1 Tax=Pseudonocardia nematodicida TaxID=1206997 RepID=A0ABV1KD00_9PSEU